MPPFTVPIYSDIYPLDQFYAMRGEQVPVIGHIVDTEVPEPYRALLVHCNDMTSTLENYYHEKLHVHVLARRSVENEYFRESALTLDESGRRVEFGAIKINLDLFPPEARHEILRERQPLGRILPAFGLEFSSRPKAFLRMVSDSFIDRALDLAEPQFLYGRRNTLLDAWERPLAEIVELLPP
ncbi:MAG: hypothetical protein ABSG59_22025 [Verrucomicrobiota bacterium]